MNEKIESRKNFIINFIYVGIIIFLFFAFFKYAFGLFVPFIAALLVAMALQKPVNAICKNKYMKRGIVSTLLVLLCFSILVTIIVLLFVWLGVELKGFINYILIELQDVPSFIARIEEKLIQGLSFLPDKIGSAVAAFVSENLSGLLDSANSSAPSFDFSIFNGPLSGVISTAKQIPVTMVAFLISIISCCFMTADFQNVKKILLSFFPKKTR